MKRPEHGDGQRVEDAASSGAVARTVVTVRPSAGRFHSTEPANSSLIRLTNVIARIAERIERHANEEAADKAA